MWNPFRRTEPEGELRPWEERVIAEVRAGRFTGYVELTFSYLVLDNPRSDILLRAFKKVMDEPGVARAFQAYCRHHQQGGVIGTAAAGQVLGEGPS